MSIRCLILLSLIGMLVDTNLFAAEALNSVQIAPGIRQYRPPNTRQAIGRRYIWNFQDKSYTIIMTIDVERYNSYSGAERYDIPKLVEESWKSIGNLTREFQRIFKINKHWSQENRVDFVLSFVQSLPYTFDDVTTGYDEFRRYAIETLIEGGGDCEDTTILVAAILLGLGESVALIYTPGHIALGVSGNFTGTSVNYQGTEYYYCETTGTGWTVGVLPDGVSKTIEAVTPLSTSRTVQPPTQPKLIAPEPTDPTPIEPTPEPTNPPTIEPEEAKREEVNSVSRLVKVILIFLIGYVLYRTCRAILENIFTNKDDNFPEDEFEYDETDTTSNSPLDQ